MGEVLEISSCLGHIHLESGIYREKNHSNKQVPENHNSGMHFLDRMLPHSVLNNIKYYIIIIIIIIITVSKTDCQKLL